MMEWECQFSAKLQGWVVEAIDPLTAECYVTQFYGPLAEDRAHAYAAWMSELNTSHQDGATPRTDAIVSGDSHYRESALIALARALEREAATQTHVKGGGQ